MAYRKYSKFMRGLAMLAALVLLLNAASLTVQAARNDDETGTEYIQISVNGTVVKTISGPANNHTWLVQGVYTSSLSMNKETRVLSYVVGKQSGTYTISLPAEYADYEIGQLDMVCTFNAAGSTNSQSAKFDNAKIDITILTVIDPHTDEEIPLPTDPLATEPPATEPPATEPSATEPPATEPPATEPPATEPPATEPPATEPPATEPPVTEPPVTEPPATEPPATEPPVTEPPATEPPTTEPLATEPPATEPPATDPGIEPYSDDEPIPDPSDTEPTATEPPATEPETPKSADVPKTGGSLYLWIALSAVSGTGLATLAVLPRRKESDHK